MATNDDENAKNNEFDDFAASHSDAEPTPDDMRAAMMEGVTASIVRRMEQVWQRPDAPLLLEGFVNGRYGFLLVENAVVIGEITEGVFKPPTMDGPDAPPGGWI
ncbi:hypothetical protein ABIA33_001225 [Streptacidiphilus sp. MAP12-16]|uniref:hypothetical protein n=1 Tax=Streptacidiphilus sp. MAP12-16 TaxID=3156300 RepID=UPI003511164F